MKFGCAFFCLCALLAYLILSILLLNSQRVGWLAGIIRITRENHEMTKCYCEINLFHGILFYNFDGMNACIEKSENFVQILKSHTKYEEFKYFDKIFILHIIFRFL